MDKRGNIALAQIFILVLGIISITSLISLEFKSVTAVEFSIVNPPPIFTTPVGIDSKKGSLTTKTAAELAAEKKGSSELATRLGAKVGRLPDALLTGFQWAFITYGIIQTLGGMFGIEGVTKDALSKAAMAGMFAQQGLSTALTNEGVWQKGFTDYMTNGGQSEMFMSGKAFANYAGLVLFAIVFLMTYKDTKTEIVKYDCEAWEAPIGGANCEKCNEQGEGLACSEYQCRSL
ncbi:MAG: hypothetical protein ABIJ05_03575, partial [Patescibacteria group bacterium]